MELLEIIKPLSKAFRTEVQVSRATVIGSHASQQNELESINHVALEISPVHRTMRKLIFLTMFSCVLPNAQFLIINSMTNWSIIHYILLTSSHHPQGMTLPS
jgi:hypothetical protein